VGGKAAQPAGELGLRRTIRFFDMAAPGAFAICVWRVQLDHEHARERRLVQDQHLELQKRPTVDNDSLPVPNLYPVADAAQLVKLNPSSGAFSRGHNLLGYYVMGMRGRALFLAREFFQAPLGRAGLLVLKLGSQAALPVAHAVHGRAALQFPIRVRRDVRDPEIDAQKIVHLGWLRLLPVTGRGEVEDSLRQDQVAFALPRCQQGKLAAASGERNFEPALQGGYRHGSLIDVPAQNPVVIADGVERAERPHRVAVQFIGVGYLPDRARGNLQGKAKADSCLPVGQLVDAGGRKLLGSPGFLADPIAGGIRRLQCFCQRALRLAVRQQFYLGCQFHHSILPDALQHWENKLLELYRREVVVSSNAKLSLSADRCPEVAVLSGSVGSQYAEEIGKLFQMAEGFLDDWIVAAS
jgi:hypothetical protein